MLDLHSVSELRVPFQYVIEHAISMHQSCFTYAGVACVQIQWRLQ